MRRFGLDAIASLDSVDDIDPRCRAFSQPCANGTALTADPARVHKLRGAPRPGSSRRSSMRALTRGNGPCTDMGWTLHPASDFVRFAPDWDARQLAAATFRSSTARSSPRFWRVRHRARTTCDPRRGTRPTSWRLSYRRGGAWQTFQPSQLPFGAWVMRSRSGLGELLEALLRRLPGLTLNFGITQVIRGFSSGPQRRVCANARLHPDGLDRDRGQLRRILGVARQEPAPKRGQTAPQARGRRRSSRAGCRSQARRNGDGLRDYGALESAGWKARGGTAIDPDNAQGRFYLAMLASVLRPWGMAGSIATASATRSLPWIFASSTATHRWY